MKKLFSTALTAAIALGVHAQPMISSGFVTGMAAINGTTYIHPGNIGIGNYQYVCGSKNEGHFFASSFTTGRLYFVDQAASTIADSMAITLYDITAENENSNLFGIGNTDSLYRINTATKSIAGATVLPGLWRLKERPNAHELWVTAINKIYVVDYANGFANTNFAVPVSQGDGGGLTFTVGGTKAYVSAYTARKLYKVDAATHTITDSSAQLPAGQYCAVVSHDSSKVFLSYPNNFRIYIVNATTLALTDSIITGTRQPFMLYRHPYRNEIWAVNHLKDSVTVYNENTHAQIATFGISSSPHHLAFGKETTSVNETTKPAERISLYPNPANGELQLSFEDARPRNIQLYDLFGREVYTQNTNTNSTTIDVSELASGAYHAAITTAGKTTTLSWIKS